MRSSNSSFLPVLEMILTTVDKNSEKQGFESILFNAVQKDDYNLLLLEIVSDRMKSCQNMLRLSEIKG